MTQSGRYSTIATMFVASLFFLNPRLNDSVGQAPWFPKELSLLHSPLFASCFVILAVRNDEEGKNPNVNYSKHFITKVSENNFICFSVSNTYLILYKHIQNLLAFPQWLTINSILNSPLVLFENSCHVIHFEKQGLCMDGLP